MPKVNFKKKSEIERLLVQNSTEFTDTNERGERLKLVLNVQPTGTKIWRISYSSPTRVKNGKSEQRRYTIGKYPAISYDDACKAAADARNKVERGIDPNDEATPDNHDISFQELWDWYDAAHVKDKAQSTRREYRRQWSTYYRGDYANVRVSGLTKRLLMTPINKLVESGNPVMAKRVHSTFSAMMKKSYAAAKIEENPLFGTSISFREQSRDRFLTHEEIKQLWHGLDKPDCNMRLDTKLAIKLGLVTGQRTGEILQMRESEIDFENLVWTPNKANLKNRQFHQVPLSDLAVGLIKQAIEYAHTIHGGECDYVFPSKTRVTANNPMSNWSHRKSGTTSHAMRDNCEVLGFSDDPVRTHDLRRTLSTQMNSAGLDPYIVEYILNHKSGARKGVAGDYNRGLPLDRMREAMEIWSQKIVAITTMETAHG